MKAYRVNTRVAANGELHLDALPFQDGDLVEVIVMARDDQSQSLSPKDLRGKVIQYKDPTEPVAQDDWSVLQ